MARGKHAVRARNKAEAEERLRMEVQRNNRLLGKISETARLEKELEVARRQIKNLRDELATVRAPYDKQLLEFSNCLDEYVEWMKKAVTLFGAVTGRHYPHTKRETFDELATRMAQDLGVDMKLIQVFLPWTQEVKNPIERILSERRMRSMGYSPNVGQI